MNITLLQKEFTKYHDHFYSIIIREGKKSLYWVPCLDVKMYQNHMEREFGMKELKKTKGKRGVPKMFKSNKKRRL